MELIAVGGPRPEDGDGNMVQAQWPEEANRRAGARVPA
jgi:hypothetical protein